MTLSADEILRRGNSKKERLKKFKKKFKAKKAKLREEKLKAEIAECTVEKKPFIERTIKRNRTP